MNQLQRIKIYVNTGDDQWVDNGIGHLSVQYNEPHYYLRAISQNPTFDTRFVSDAHLNTKNEQWCLNLRILPTRQYTKQGDNIIFFQDTERNCEIALSFIDSAYLKEIYASIKSIQGKENNQQHFKFDELDQCIQPAHQNLDSVQAQINDNPDSVIASITNDNSYLDALQKTFEEAETLQQEYVLDQLYYLLRSLIYLKNEDVLRRLLSDKYYMTVFGIMEYHVENKGAKRVSYRNFLKNHLRFHLLDEQFSDYIIDLIHFNYRLTYLKESVMAYYLYMEDPTYITFTNLISSNSRLILQSLLYNHRAEFTKFLTNFNDGSDLSFKCKFLNEFIQTFRQFLTYDLIYTDFIDILKESQFLEIIQNTITENTNDQSICCTLLSFISLMLHYSYDFFKDHLIKDREQFTFWNNLTTLLFHPQFTQQTMIYDIIQLLIKDSYQMPPSLFTDFNIWLNQCLQRPLDITSATILQQILQHVISTKENTNQNHFKAQSSKILDLFKQKNKFLLMPALKHYKYLLQVSQQYYFDILEEYGQYIIQLAKQKQFGVLEGQIREIVKLIAVKPIAAQMSKYCDDSTILAPIKQAINQIKYNQEKIEEERYFEKEGDDSEQGPTEIVEHNREDQQNEQHTHEEQPQLSLEKIVRRRPSDEEDVFEQSKYQQEQTKPPLQIVFGEITKKVKLD